MVRGDVSDLMGHLFSGRAEEVTLLLGNGAVLVGHPTHASLKRPRSVTITTPSAEQLVVQPGDIVWASASGSDGSVATFGTPEGDFLIVLAEWLPHATSEEQARLETTSELIERLVHQTKTRVEC